MTDELKREHTNIKEHEAAEADLRKHNFTPTFSLRSAWILGAKTHIEKMKPEDLAAHEEAVAREAWEAAIKNTLIISETPKFEDWWKNREKD